MRALKQEPLWIRVDRNRVKITAFVVLFITGSSVLLTAALVAVPGYLLSWGASEFDYGDSAQWYAAMPVVLVGSIAGLLMIGGVIAAVQLANAEHWVRSRFQARDAAESEAPSLRSALHDMSLAAGLPAPPALVVMPGESVNAFAIGTTRTNPVIGVTEGLLAELDPDEERAVVATLVARIVAGDIMFGTALAALMGPLKAVRGSATAGSACLSGQGGSDSSGTGSTSGCTDGCGSTHGCGGVGDFDSDDAGGFVVFVLFLIVVAILTYAAVVTASWIVTLWGRALHRTSYEKADAEGMLLLKDPGPMLSALGKAVASSNEVLEGDASYDAILYASASGKPGITRIERRRFRRLAEVLGVDGATAEARFAEKDGGSP